MISSQTLQFQLKDGHVHKMLELADDRNFGISCVTEVCEEFLISESKMSDLAKYLLAEKYRLHTLKVNNIKLISNFNFWAR